VQDIALFYGEVVAIEIPVVFDPNGEETAIVVTDQPAYMTNDLNVLTLTPNFEDIGIS